jgi:hypothetical protein
MGFLIELAELKCTIHEIDRNKTYRQFVMAEVMCTGGE